MYMTALSPLSSYADPPPLISTWRSFDVTHHMRQISSAAVITDAANIDKELNGLKISHAAGAA